MENTNIEVTVVIPVFNQEHFIGSAIESVLNQTCKGYRILVVDDGSTDATPKILNGYKPMIDVIRQRNTGTSAAWNTAIEAASSEYLVGLDSDDEFVPDTIASVTAKALAMPNASVIYSDYEFINAAGTATKQVRNPEAHDPIAQLIRLHDRLGQPDNFLPFGHVRLYQKNALVCIGGYDVSYLYADDFDLVLRLAEHGKTFVRVPEVLYRYRWHETNKGVIARKEQINEVRRSVRDFRHRNNLNSKR